jgi:osmoprotectant transport system permease protein
MRWVFAIAILLFSYEAEAAVKIGSKRFPESAILAEIATQTARAEGIDAVHEQGLGATAVVFRALEDGSIDVYPEYTGTLGEVLKGDTLASRGLAQSEPIGFEDRYALAVRRDAGKLARISDLAARHDLSFGLSHEFVGRADGWPGLAARYRLEPASIRTLDHALAYEALVRGAVDVVDVYTTDAKIARYGLVVLEDDAHFFPRYDAVLVYRADLPKRVPAFERVLAKMRGSIDEDTMRKLNARAELDTVPFDRVAADFLRGGAASAAPPRRGLASGIAASIARYGPRHVGLVGASLLLSTLIGVPLGLLAYARPRMGGAVLGITGIVQTIPSLALFCFMIPLLGIGTVPALAALFLYGLLPIVRNTHAGLASIPGDLREAAVALGLSPVERLRYVEVPLASRTIVAGIKTSAIVAVGSATIAAFIGAGGFGEPISTGLSLNDVQTILEGAVPAAGLALVVQGMFALLERAVVPRGLR